MKSDSVSNEDELPTAVWSGSFRIFGVDVVCHRLSNGMAIIDADSMIELIEAMDAPAGRELGDIEAFYQWREGK